MSARNKIAQAQNLPRQLQLLGAQRMLYRRAKFALLMRIWLSAIALAAFAIVSLILPDLKWVTALAGLAIFALDFCYFSRREKDFRLTAARVQEAFDCSIYQMEWSRIAGTPEPPETEIRENRGYQKIAAKCTPLSDWYCVPDSVDHWVGVALCQRSNVQWDTRQRTRYVAALQTVLVSVWSILVVVGVGLNPLFRDALPVALALLPISKLLLDQIRDHRDVLAKQERLKSSVETLLTEAAKGGSPGSLKKSARALQDDIFEYRARGPLVLEWVFYSFRQGQQQEMELAIQQIAEKLMAQQGAVASSSSRETD